MTELELYKFIDEYNIEHRWNGEEFLVWIPFYVLDDFMEMVSDSFFDEGGYEVNLQCDYICLDLAPIASYEDIELENILKK
jgi:hypothetical protein